MKLSSFFIVTIGMGVLSYPVMNLPGGKPFFVDRGSIEAEPVPKPDKPKIEFAMTTLEDEEDVEISSQKEMEYRIIINVPATKLILLEDERPVMEFPVAVGQVIYKTPIGHQEINRIEWNPWWYPPKSDWAKHEKITPPGPKNPLGPVKFPMSEDIRLHGTTKDYSIGRAASHGCIRMHSKDALTLAWYIQQHLTDKGDPSYLEKYQKQRFTTFHVKLNKPIPVEIIYEPVAFLDDMLTIYPDIYGKVKDIKSIAEWKLFSSGIDPWEVEHLKSLPKAVKRPFSLPISDRSDIDVDEFSGIISDSANF